MEIPFHWKAHWRVRHGVRAPAAFAWLALFTFNSVVELPACATMLPNWRSRLVVAQSRNFISAHRFHFSSTCRVHFSSLAEMEFSFQPTGRLTWNFLSATTRHDHHKSHLSLSVGPPVWFLTAKCEALQVPRFLLDRKYDSDPHAVLNWYTYKLLTILFLVQQMCWLEYF